MNTTKTNKKTSHRLSSLITVVATIGLIGLVLLPASSFSNATPLIGIPERAEISTSLLAQNHNAPPDTTSRPVVIATIPPLHSLVLGVLGETADVHLLLPGAVSPHHFNLKPSQVRKMQNAKVIFYVDDYLETPLRKALQSLPSKVQRIPVTSAPGITLLPLRLSKTLTDAMDDDDDTAEKGAGHHDEHHSEHGDSHGDKHGGHDDHHDGHDKHDGHDDHHDGHDKHDGHHDEHHSEHGDSHGDKHGGHDDHHDGHDKHDGHHDEHHSEHGDSHGDHHGGHGGHGTYSTNDLHVWLSPSNAKIIARHIARVMTALYPEQQATYAKNVATLTRRIDTLDSQLQQQLAPVKNTPFIVFHDAYLYFEQHYNLNGLGSILSESHTPPSAQRIQKIRKKIVSANVACVFHEPQFSNRLIDILIEGGIAKSATLDPLGASLRPGKDLYFQLLNQLASSLAGCLAG